MAAGMQIVNGIAFGTGLILASAAMKAVFHMSFC